MPPNGRCAYGSLAESYSRCFNPTDPIIVFDHHGAGEALRDAAARAFRNERFYVRAVLPQHEALRATAITPSVLDAFTSSEERHFALSQAWNGTLSVNGVPLGTTPAYAPGALRAMQAILRLASGLVASSEAERRRVEQILDTQPEVIVGRCDDPSIPRASNPDRERDAIVIWAPHLGGDAGLAYAYALKELRATMLLVAATPPRQDAPVTYVQRAEAAGALARAYLIVDTSPVGCDAVAALSTWRVPVIADRESGASEAFAHVRCYDQASLPSVFDAASAAIGYPAPRPRSERSTSLEFPTPNLLKNGPLVSVVIPTLDRPFMLAEALESIARQTYKDIETIVVIDGGPRLDHLAKRFPNVQFLHMSENNPLQSSNTAFARTTGKYVTFLNDDDVYFPDHVAALVTALERSGGSVAHGDVLTAFLRGGDQTWETIGFESNMSRAVALGALMVGNQIGMTSCMFRRDRIADDAPFEEEVPLYRDYALWLRLAWERDFIHVERLTSCYTIRNDGSGQQSNMWYDRALRSYEILYEKYPATDRPRLQQERLHVLAAVQNEHMKLRPEAAVTIAPTAWPLWKR